MHLGFPRTGRRDMYMCNFRTLIKIIPLEMDILNTEIDKKFAEKLKHLWTFYFLYNYINMGVLCSDIIEHLKKFCRNGLLIPMSIKITHVYSVEFYRIYLIKMVDTNQIMISNRMEIINSDLVSFSSEFS